MIKKLILAAGLNYLHQHKIKRKNIKPQYVLCQILENSDHIYKINCLNYVHKLDENKDYDKTASGDLDKQVLERKIAKNINFFDKYSVSTEYEMLSLGATIHQVISGKLPNLDFFNNSLENKNEFLENLFSTSLIPKQLHIKIKELFYNLFIQK